MVIVLTGTLCLVSFGLIDTRDTIDTWNKLLRSMRLQENQKTITCNLNRRSSALAGFLGLSAFFSRFLSFFFSGTESNAGRVGTTLVSQRPTSFGSSNFFTMKHFLLTPALDVELKACLLGLKTKHSRVLLSLLLLVAAVDGISSVFGQSSSSDPVVSCSESGLQFNNWEAQLSLAQFDPSLGELERVELHLEGKTVASMEIKEAAIPAGQSQIKLSSQLAVELPGAQKLHLQPVAELKEYAYKQKEQFTGVEEHQTIIDEDLQPYLGTGKLVIPTTGQGYNSKNSKEPVQLHTQSALSVCVHYYYQPKQ